MLNPKNFLHYLIVLLLPWYSGSFSTYLPNISEDSSLSFTQKNSLKKQKIEIFSISTTNMFVLKLLPRYYRICKNIQEVFPKQGA
jgi:hypothetical protein